MTSPDPAQTDLAPREAPYGEWLSPIDAAELASSGHTVSDARYVGGAVWWLEKRPDEGGRYAVRTRDEGTGCVDVLPPPWNARTRVHEYGGGAWVADPARRLVLVEHGDQRLYRLDAPGSEPVPLTPTPPAPAAWRYAELQIVGDEVWCVRERHAPDGGVARDLAAVPLDGSAATTEAPIRSVLAGSRFLAGARVSPDGRHVAWIAWDPPQMPWDGTRLHVAELSADGVAGPRRTLLGSATESVLQPEWAGPDELLALSDASGFWNLVSVPIDGRAPRPVAPVEAEVGGPLWTLGARWFLPLEGGRLLVARTLGATTLSLLDPATGRWTDLDLGDHTSVTLADVRAGRALVISGGARTVHGLREIDFTAEDRPVIRDVRLSVDDVPDERYLPVAEQETFPGVDGRPVHAIVHRPRNPGHVGPPGELPPFVAFVHGGPTSHVGPALSLAAAYFTSRGIGVVDVDYGGSTGWGRAYRERLRGQWGVVDVEDVVAAVQGLVDRGLADPRRLAIEGASAGGWTVLAALTSTDAFACGSSFYGVADLPSFAEQTHDFEAHYLDGLVGPLPEAAQAYRERSPLNRVDALSCPVLLLQGLDDPVVPPEQAEAFRAALVAKGIPHACIRYEGESHGFRRAETVTHSREATLSFYGQVLGFRPPGVPLLPLELAERLPGPGR